MRQYLTGDGSRPAPSGTFLYLGVGFGSTDIDGSHFRALNEVLEYNDGILGNGPDCLPNTLRTYHYEDVRTRYFETGFGYQGFLNTWLTLEGKMALNLSYLNTDGEYSKRVTTGVARTYGPNLFQLNTTDFQFGPTRSCFGLSAYLQLGVMLF